MVDFTKFTPDNWHDWFVGASSGISYATKYGLQGTVVASIISAASGGIARPWMAKAVADLVQNQDEIDKLRELWVEVAELCGVDKDPALSPSVITAHLNELLKSGDGAGWQLAANGYKAHLKHKGRVIVEALALGKLIFESVSASTAVTYPMAMFLSEGWRRAIQSHKAGPIRFPFVIWNFTTQERNKAQSLLWHYNDAQDLAYHSQWTVEELANQQVMPPVEPLVQDFAHVEGKPKSKTVVGKVKTEVQEEAALKLAKLQAAIQDMVKVEVGKALNQTTIEGLMVGATAKCLVNNPNLLKQAMSGQSANILLVIKENVSKAMAAHDVEGIVKDQVTQQVAQQVATKLDPAKLKKDLAAQLLANSDDYFVAIFDRVVVESTHDFNPQGIGAKPGTVIGKLAIKEAFAPKAPTLDPKTKPTKETTA